MSKKEMRVPGGLTILGDGALSYEQVAAIVGAVENDQLWSATGFVQIDLGLSEEKAHSVVEMIALAIYGAHNIRTY